MNELIKITETNGKKVVSARELHNLLEVKNHFTQWFDDNKNQFDEHFDYEAVKAYIKASNGIGGTNKIDYALTLDCAKEMSMLSKVPKGKIVRKYFIECEKKLNSPSNQIKIPSDYLSALKALVISEEQKQLALQEAQQQKQLAIEAIDLAEDLEKDIEKIKPQAEYCERVLKSKDTYLTSEIADELGMSAIKLNRFLRTHKVQYKTSGSRWMLYQQHRDKGYTDTKTAEYHTKDNEVRTSSNMVWTEKGRMFIHNLLKIKS